MQLNKSMVNLIKYSLCILATIYINFAFAEIVSSDKTEVHSNVEKLNIEVSNLERPSLGSIGVKTKLNKTMGLDIWKGMNAANIVEHFNYIPDVVTSKDLQAFLIELYLSTSNPPSGNSEEIIKFLETRLIKIRRSGQSEKLYQLIKQLPEGNRWNIWKRWLIEYELIGRQDQKACSHVYEVSKNNFDHFWQTARIFCLSINDKLSQAEFILDLIKVKDFTDPIFEDLFQIMNNEKETLDLKNNLNQILPIHLIMMDTIKTPIKVNYIAHMSIEYTESLLKLTYLTPRARSFLLDKKINYSFVSTDQIIEDYKSVSNGEIGIENSLSNYKKKPNGQARANVWFSVLTIKDDIKKVETIFKIINFEIKNGRFYHSINLYLPILQEINSASLTKKLNNLIAKLLIVKNPVLFPEDQLANTLLLKEGAEWEWQFILQQKAWTLIPVLEDAGMVQPKSFDWLKVLNKTKNQNTNEQKYNKWNKNYNLKSFLLTKGIEEASNNNEKALTLILLARLLGNDPLVDFEIGQLMTIRKSLFKLGFNELADNLTLEIMIPKLISF